jgi:hypothetical protein
MSIVVPANPVNLQENSSLVLLIAEAFDCTPQEAISALINFFEDIENNV